MNSDYLRIIFPDGKKVEIGNHSIVSTPSTENHEILPKLYLNKDKGMKLDVIRIVSVCWELGFVVDEHGRKATKKDLFQALGILLNTDFSNASSDLSNSLDNGNSMDKHLKIFRDMLEKMKDIFNKR